MTEMLGVRVTKKMLDAYTGDSNAAYRFPCAFELAFCRVVGDFSALADRVTRAGFRMIGPEEENLIEIGKAYLQIKQAESSLRKVKL